MQYRAVSTEKRLPRYAGRPYLAPASLHRDVHLIQDLVVQVATTCQIHDQPTPVLLTFKFICSESCLLIQVRQQVHDPRMKQLLLKCLIKSRNWPPRHLHVTNLPSQVLLPVVLLKVQCLHLNDLHLGVLLPAAHASKRRRTSSQSVRVCIRRRSLDLQSHKHKTHVS